MEKVRVDIGANYLIIDLVPFRFNSVTKHSPCFREDRGRLQVRVMLPPKRWCQPLDEIQEYLYDKTLDIWTDFQSLRNCRPKRSGFQIPFESENYWMMVSQRVFYSKRWLRDPGRHSKGRWSMDMYEEGREVREEWKASGRGRVRERMRERYARYWRIQNTFQYV